MLSETEFAEMAADPNKCIKFAAESMGDRPDRDSPRHEESVILSVAIMELVDRMGASEKTLNAIYCILGVVYDMGLVDGGQDGIPDAFKDL